MEDKYCRFCGALLPEEALFCTKCGKATAAESGETDESASDHPESSFDEQPPVTESDDEESYTEADKERSQGERDTADESARNTDSHESHWLKRSEDQLDREIEVARGQRVAQQKQKWNRKRIIIVAAMLALVVVVMGCVLWPKAFPKEFPAGINTYAVKGEPYYQWKRKLPHVARIVDECHQYGYTGELTSSTQLDSVLFMPKSDRLLIIYDWGLSLDSGDISAYGENTEKAMSCMASAIGYHGNLSAMLDEFAQDNKKNDGIESLDEVSPRALTNDVAVRCMWTLGATGPQNLGHFLCGLTEEKVSDSSSDSSDTSGESSEQSDSSSDGQSTSNSDQAPSDNGSTSVDADFTDLWTAVAIKEDLSKIAGEYCRNDGACVKINANSGHTAGDYSTKPGEISFTSGDQASNPLPGQSTELGLSFAFQQQPTTVPDTVTPIDMQTMTDGCNAASDSSCQAGVTYVMSGVGTSRFSDRVESGNPPDSNKSYLVIGWQTKVSNDTVFYRK